MRVKTLCHKLLSSTNIHQKRLTVLGEVLETVLDSKQLSVTTVGRKMKNTNQSRSNIRKVDRLYSNAHLYHEREIIYRTMATWIINSPRPFIVVDGSKLPNSQCYTLRASVIAKGRALTVYECTFTQAEYGSLKLYKRFLAGLGRVLPKDTVPILITDAEFRTPWFKEVYALGWDFIGRVRGNAQCAMGDEDFIPCKDIFLTARQKPRCLGQGSLTASHDCDGYFYLYHRPKVGRHATKHCLKLNNKHHAETANEPWLLFSSLEVNLAQHIIKAYEYRMTIEENFRDTKSTRYGLALEMTFSKSHKRYAIMLLLAMLASVIAYLVGTLAELKQWHYQFQATSTKNKRVLSRFFLGAEVLYKQLHFSLAEFLNALHFLQEEVYETFA